MGRGMKPRPILAMSETYNCDVCGQYIEGAQLKKHNGKIYCKAHYLQAIAKEKNKKTPKQYKSFQKLMKSCER